MSPLRAYPGLPIRRAPTARILVLAAVTAVACADTFEPAPDGTLAIGTWGAEGAGVIVSETGTRVHIGCTFGDIEGTISVIDGRLTVDGSYMLRAYPVAVGPTVPAQFSGQLVGRALTLAVAVNDTVENQLVSLGPVTVTHGREPEMAQCPICRVPPNLVAPKDDVPE